METIGMRLKRLRAKMGVSQGCIAKAMCVHRTTYLKWEADKNTPSHEKAERLAGILGVEANYILFGKSDNRYREPDHICSWQNQVS